MISIQTVKTVKPIRDEHDLKLAHERLDELILIQAYDSAEADLRDEFEILSALIFYYEQRTQFSKPPKPAGDIVELIENAMENKGLKQKALAELLECSVTRVSEILSRKRPVSFQIAKQLHRKLGIPAEALLNQTEE